MSMNAWGVCGYGICLTDPKIKIKPKYADVVEDLYITPEMQDTEDILLIELGTFGTYLYLRSYMPWDFNSKLDCVNTPEKCREYIVRVAQNICDNSKSELLEMCDYIDDGYSE